jgi:cell pole-organizing protein PopZ
MSEQTPNSPDRVDTGAEPSMEDILASIRKIIAEDEPVPLESPEDTVAEFAPAQPMSDAMLEVGESLDLDIDEALADIEANEAFEEIEDFEAVVEAPVVESIKPASWLAPITEDDVVQRAPAPVIEDVQPAEAAVEAVEEDDDILALLDMDIPMASDDAAQAVMETNPIDSLAPVAEAAAEDSPSEMDSLLDSILEETDDIEPSALTATAAAATGVAGAALASAVPVSVESDPDLELVKTLMADLSDMPEGDADDADLDALLAIPEAEPEEAFAVDEAETPEAETFDDQVELQEDEAPAVEAGQEDILGDILDMTLEDELQTHPEDLSSDTVAADELTNLVGNAEPVGEVSETPSLSDIADAAQAEATALETPQAAASTAGLATSAGLAALGAAVVGKTVSTASTEAASEAEVETPHVADPTAELDSHTEQTETLPSQQEPEMPVKAVKTDAILDEVTETATASAFADLNQVVEEKATFNERGPRIGDLVQEALRPMLKEWLDANLKGIVERAVTKEVKRISSGK